MHNFKKRGSLILKETASNTFKILIFIAIFINICLVTFTEDKYIPKNDIERKTLNSLKNKKIKIGFQDSFFTNEVVADQSLDSLIEEMLSEYIGLNIEVEFRPWESLYNGFENGEIDIIPFLTKNSKRQEIAIFSNKLFDEYLYMGSKKDSFFDIKELDEKEVSVTKGSIYEHYLDKFVENNDLFIKKIYVENASETINTDYYVDSNLNMLEVENKIEISKLPATSIAVLKKHRDLIPIINNALKNKYEKKINKWIYKRNNKISKDKFMELLTIEEKEYLENTNELSITYESIGISSYFSKRTNKFEGIIPDLSRLLFKKIGINLEEKKIENFEWGSIFDSFKKEEIDILPLSKNEDRKKEFLFTKKIYEMAVYKIDCLKDHKEKSKKIGVIKNTIEAKIIREYYLDEDIILYKDYNKMLKDFKKHEIGSIIVLEPDRFEREEYSIDIVENIPINLGLHNHDNILQSILNKAIDSNTNFKQVVAKSILNKKLEKLELEGKEKLRYDYILYGSLFLLSITLLQTYRVLRHKKKNDELLKDELTGLLSRRVYTNFCKKNNEAEGVAFLLDLNKFKEVNDVYGHNLGDKVLIEASSCIKKAFEKDFVFRISGDEFYVFSNNLEDTEEKIKNLKKLFLGSILLRKFSVSFSLGYYIKEKSINMKKSFKYADMAMYEAKREKDKYWCKEATKDFIIKNQRRERIKELLEKSINTEMYAVFQNKYELTQNKLSGVEALARWQNKELGFVSPMEFISVAEEINIIHKIDYKIAKETIKMTKNWIDNNKVSSNFRASFNLSVETFKREDVVSRLLKLLDMYELDGKNIEIEITESMFLSNTKDIVKKLNELKARDIKISLDDFTAGYSTVGLLTILPIDIVKFDRSLILAVEDDEIKGKVIYTGLIKIMKSLDLKIVAEGIETIEELEFLKENMVEYGQGFYLGKPKRYNENMEEVCF